MKKLIFGLSGLFLLMIIVGLVFVAFKLGNWTGSTEFTIIPTDNCQVLKDNNDNSFKTIAEFQKASGFTDTQINQIKTSFDLQVKNGEVVTCSNPTKI